MASTRNIEHEVTIGAPPARVYEALMSSRGHRAFTGEPAKINARVGGSFTCYDGYITGVTLLMKPARLIIQAWHAAGWPPDVYSIVTFSLSPTRGGKTKLRFSQVGVPADDYGAKSSGWTKHYWKPLKAYFEKNGS